MLETAVCPVLSLTPDVVEALSWFHATHELSSDSGRVWWRCVALPAAGGAGEQDGLLMRTLDYLKALMNGLAVERVRADRARRRRRGPEAEEAIDEII